MEQILQQIKDIVINVVTFIFPTIAIGLSILSYKDSRKTNKLQARLMQVEDKLKIYELEDKEKEREEATQACVEARIINISKGSYKMRIYNSGKATAFNVNFQIPEEYENMVWRAKVPFEFLDPGKNFEEHVLVHSGTPEKLKITTTWTDINEKHFSKDQIVTI